MFLRTDIPSRDNLHVLDMVIPTIRNVMLGLVLVLGLLLLVLWGCMVWWELLIGGLLLLRLGEGLLLELFTCGSDGSSIFGLLVQRRVLAIALVTGRLDVRG